jgi:hypothetical protein
VPRAADAYAPTVVLRWRRVPAGHPEKTPDGVLVVGVQRNVPPPEDETEVLPRTRARAGAR